MVLDVENMQKQFNPNEATKLYEALQNYADTRTKEMSGMAEPYIKITDIYGRLISRLVLLLGGNKPVNTQDIVIRDLMTDVFDCLYESRTLILSGKLNIAFPIGRRAYESLSLLHLCSLDKAWAEKWHKGKKIENYKIREELGVHPKGESKEQMKELYNFFCIATHPNRELIPRRFLGEGNEYVLGAIGEPNLVIVLDYCTKNLEMWYWLTATVSYFYKEVIAELDKGYYELYQQAAKEAQKVKVWLIENYNNLLREEQKYWENHPVEE